MNDLLKRTIKKQLEGLPDDQKETLLSFCCKSERINRYKENLEQAESLEDKLHWYEVIAATQERLYLDFIEYMTSRCQHHISSHEMTAHLLNETVKRLEQSYERLKEITESYAQYAEETEQANFTIANLAVTDPELVIELLREFAEIYKRPQERTKFVLLKN